MTNLVGRSVRGTLRNASRARQLRRRRPPEISYDAAGSTPAVVYYLTPDDNAASGGIRNLYRHVDLLNGAGIPAAVMHSRAGFRCDWFDNTTRVVGAGEVTLGSRDLLVVPEYYGPGLENLPAGLRKLIFNQNAYHTFNHIPFMATATGAPYADVAGVLAMVAVSQDNAALLRHTFPAVEVHVARVVVDERVFHPPARPAGRRIGYMPRRRAEEQEQLLHVLRARGVLDGWQLVPIDGRTEAQTAEALQSCSIFLSFSEREGFGLPPAEAMASACYVVGFTGLGGRDFFDPQFCTPVVEGDLLAFAVGVEEAIRWYDDEPDALVKAGRAASEHVLSRYHEDGLRADLVQLYGSLR